jgi:transcriptional regulator with XRE-family HTH domain
MRPGTLRRLRRARGLSQSALAAQAGLSRGYLARLETGERDNPSLKTVVQLARALRVPVTDLLGGTA